VRIFRAAGELLLGEDERKLLAKLRRERSQEPRVWAARLACALGVTLVGFGTGYWLITLILAAFVLSGKRAGPLAYGCLFGALFATALLIDAVVAGSNLYVALFFGVSAVLFALADVLVLTTGVTFFGHLLAVRRLRRAGDVEGLIAQITAPDPLTRAEAADALASLADPRAEQSLLQALADPDPGVRANAVRALGVLKSGEAVERLLAALGDEDDDVRYMASWALGRIGDPRAIEQLRLLAADGDGPAQDAARDALQFLGASTTGPAK
jgi:HEAT repeats